MLTLRGIFTFTKRVFWRGWSSAILISLLCSSGALASSGGLDTTFSGDGKVTTSFGPGFNSDIYGIALQSDGKIVAVGESFDPGHATATTHSFALARYNTNGTLDSTFSNDGKQVTDFGGADTAWGAAVQSNGKIVVSGTTCNSSSICDLAVARYNTNGSLDTTFNVTGKKVVDYGTGDNGGDTVRIESDGKIVVAGWMNNGSNEDFAVYRFNSNGSLDTTFSGDGMVSFGFGTGRNDQGDDLAFQAVGKIVVVGPSCDAAWRNCNFALAQLNSDGSLDSTFSGDGKVITNFGGNALAFNLAIQSDSKIVAAGRKCTPVCDAAVARYNTNGALDTTFNITGKKLIDFNGGDNGGTGGIVIQPNGKIVVVGYMNNGSNNDFAIYRLNTNGSLDTTFNGSGKVAINFGQWERGRDIALQKDGKYVVAGSTGTDVLSPSGKYNFALARVLP